jgi:hypothetical protein
MASRGLLLLALLLLAGPAPADELVRVRITRFTGAEPASLSSASHPQLFVLAPGIASAQLTAVNDPAAIEDGGPGRWLPVMTPAPPSATAGTIELTITPQPGSPVAMRLLRFRADARFTSNPSSFVLTSSLDNHVTPLALIDLAESVTTTRFPNAAASDAAVTFRWTAGNDFGENGGGAAGFGGEDVVVATPACPSVPAPDCADPGGASLSLSATRGQELAWSWSGGSAALGDFGAPDQGALLAFCLYDESGLALQALAGSGACGKKPCWKAQSSGVSFKDKTGGENGITALKLKAGDGKASIKLAGRGSQLDLPLPLAAATGVRAQLVRSDGGACFESVFPAPAETDAALEYEDSIP